MFPRLTPAILVASLAVGLAACSSIPAAPVGPTSPASRAVAPAIAEGSQATAIESRMPSPTIAPKPAPTAPDTGNVGGPVTPALSIEPVGTSAIRVTLADPAAKAWRLTVAGTGAHAADRWSLTVETGDVAPVITTVDTVNGVDGQPQEQPGLEMGDANGRVCALNLPVCLRAASVVLPQDGNGTLVLELTRTDATVALDVTGGTATWTTDPFVLGPWTTTEAFPWAA
jgi:hypothetical protein